MRSHLQESSELHFQEDHPSNLLDPTSDNGALQGFWRLQLCCDLSRPGTTGGIKDSEDRILPVNIYYGIYLSHWDHEEQDCMLTYLSQQYTKLKRENTSLCEKSLQLQFPLFVDELFVLEDYYIASNMANSEDC